MCFAPAPSVGGVVALAQAVDHIAARIAAPIKFTFKSKKRKVTTRRNKLNNTGNKPAGFKISSLACLGYMHHDSRQS